MAEEESTAQTPTSTSEKPSSTPKSSSIPVLKQHQFQLSPFYGFGASPNGDLQMFPIMYPTLVPGILPSQQGQEQMNSGAGIYAVPSFPFMGTVAGFPSNTLIPFTYNVPVTRASPEAGTVSEVQGQVGQQQQPHQQQAGQQRPVVRRFQIAIHLDLFLILKLAAVIFLFNQDGSRQRLVLLLFFALIVYFYQTGALAPVIAWLTQGMQRAAVPPQPPRQAVRADNAPAAARQGNENPPLAGDEQGGAENDANNQQEADRNQVENEQEPRPENGNNRWWGIVKEIQMIVFGFITSLLPGFHNID